MDQAAPLHDVFVEAYQLAEDVRRLRDAIVAAGTEVPEPARQLLNVLPDRAVHLRDVIHDTGLDADNELAVPRLS